MTELRIGILLLQETHLTSERRAHLHRMFADRVKIFASEHPTAPTQREGVAIVLNKKLISAKGVTMKEIIPGRAIQVAVPWRGGDVREILCVYAPTTEGALERRDFFIELKEFYERHSTHPKPHLMAGDFNNVEDALDRVPVPADGRDASVEALDDLKASLGLMMTDGWRATNPTERGFTFQRGAGQNLSMSRLDRMYIRGEELKWAREWSITPVGVKTDHCLVSVLLTTPHTPAVGKGRPVFPLFLLPDKKLKVKMKERGIEAIRELEDIARQGRTAAHNPQLVLARLKKDWLESARQREKAIVPTLTKEIE
ncbi:DNase I-like protein, partial [Trametes versicolor FP-101664 SS1]|uniref:DNase I-like protein n=1 Tax=Trametes versicolor (strain FP-101664) TaxID=717944 RepID=UPI0004621CB4